MKILDINTDMGEYPEFLKNGLYENLMDYVTTINVACGGHAGNKHLMKRIVKIARTKKVNIGAHPGYPDRDNFGRIDLKIEPDHLLITITNQIQMLRDIAEDQGITLSHVKVHGALYNRATRDKMIAQIIGEAVLKVNPRLTVIGLAGSIMVDAFTNMGLKVIEEAFADRTYDMNGCLSSRTFRNALITDPKKAAIQAKLISKGKIIALDGSELDIKAQTICIHSDTPHALAIAKEVHTAMNK